jgi:hypothetical protein
MGNGALAIGPKQPRPSSTLLGPQEKIPIPRCCRSASWGTPAAESEQAEHVANVENDPQRLWPAERVVSNEAHNCLRRTPVHAGPVVSSRTWPLGPLVAADVRRSSSPSAPGTAGAVQCKTQAPDIGGSSHPHTLFNAAWLAMLPGNTSDTRRRPARRFVAYE